MGLKYVDEVERDRQMLGGNLPPLLTPFLSPGEMCFQRVVHTLSHTHSDDNEYMRQKIMH